MLVELLTTNQGEYSMAIYRQIHISFWEDTKVTDDFTAEDKYFMLYLLTNTKTNLLGCYEISPKQIAYDMGYSVDAVRALLERFEKTHKIIYYENSTKEILIRNWSKYNWNESPKLAKALTSGLDSIKTSRFKEILSNIIQNIPYAYPIDTVSKKEEKKIYPIDTTVTVTVSDTVSDTGTNNTISSNFDTFWLEYPRKESKAKTKQWFDKNKPNDDLMIKILESLKKAKATKQWQDKNYIPHPTTWLNQRRWEDEVIEAAFQNGNKKIVAVPEWYDAYAKELNNHKGEEELSPEEVSKILEEANKKYN